MPRNCASCANYTARKDLDDHLARACGEAYRGVCRLPVEPVQGAFIRRVEYHVDCRNWRAEEALLAA